MNKGYGDTFLGVFFKSQVSLRYSSLTSSVSLQVYGSEGLWSGVNDALQILGGTVYIMGVG